MDRLTEECIDGYTYKEYGREDKVYNKLGKLEDFEEELGCSLVDLLNGLKSKRSVLRYFDKYDAIHCHCKEGWYVNMIMYGWIPLKDFIKGLNNKEEK